MDKFIKRFDAERYGELMLCLPRGVGYQAEMKITAKYDETYWNKCAGYEGQEIARKINAGRVALVDKYAAGAKTVDIGIGCGEFIKHRPGTFGYDINPVAMRWLQEEKLWAEDLSAFDAYTFWDVIEHVEDPEHYFRCVKDGGYVFSCLPIASDLKRVKDWKHYRPGEHLYYWTEQGFIDWMAHYRFRLLERQTFEIDAGREGIVSFAFQRDMPGYNETIHQYEKLHAPFYGASAWLYMEAIAPVVLGLNPSSILDYGCGRSDLVAHFWNDGRRRIAKYDPAINTYQVMPEGHFDLVLCCDVMEHILMQDIDRILHEIRAKSERALFTISLRPARARLPDGRNAHVTLLNGNEWTRWIKSVFGQARQVPTKWDHILMLKTF